MIILENSRESQWCGFKRLDFDFEGRETIIIVPETPDDKGRWLLKTEYFGAYPNFEIEMVKRGFHLVHIKNKTRWHDDSDDVVKAHLCEFLHKEFSLQKKCMPVGMSCGGMQGIYFGAKYPQYVACLYLDAPVVNLLSCPGGFGDSQDTWIINEFLEHKGMTKTDLMYYTDHPYVYLPKLIEADIPIMLICGDSDKIVPYIENGKPLYDYYTANGGKITQIVKPGCDHHPHGLEDITPIIEFAYENY